MLENILDQTTLNNARNFVKREYKDIITAQEPTKQIQTTTTQFLTQYHALRTKLKPQLKQIEETTQKMYCAALSAQIITTNREQTTKTNFEKINFNTTEYETNFNIIKNYTEYIQKTHTTLEIKNNTYFNSLKKHIIQRIYPQIHINKELINLIDIEQTTITLQTRKEEIKKETQIEFTKIQEQDIIGNDEIKKELKQSARCLFLYDEEHKKNPAQEKNKFKQAYLLTGEPGNGKGMLGAYAATIAQELSKKTNKDFKLLTFSPYSKYQDGPILLLRDYLYTINTKPGVYLVILDELETLFPSRINEKTQEHKTELVTELLKFTSSPFEYTNKGNYMLIGITNNPSALDPAFLNRINDGIRLCEGPKTAEQKIELIQKILYQQIPKNKIQVKNWTYIGDVAQELKLSGRELNKSITSIIQNQPTNTFEDNLYSEKYDEVLKFFDKYENITHNQIINTLMCAGENREVQNYLTTGGYVAKQNS